MLRTLKPIAATGMFILYTGIMLLGDSLHQLLGCEHCHALTATSLSVLSSAGESGIGVTGATAVAGTEDAHDPETCPLCQFHAQGQLVPSLAGGELNQVVTNAPLVCVPVVFAVRAPSVHGPRPPPSA